MPVALAQLSLKGRALRLLSMREHSRVELERKLAGHADGPEQLQKVLDELQAKDFLSDERFVESVLNRRSPKLGAGRIRQELHGKGLDSELVGAALDSLKGTEVERAREVWKRQFDGPPQDAAERGRQTRFLAARGFGGEVIRRVLSDPGEQD